ncbi:MAG: MMPL family transporter [Chloroflexi bacterium]|nr:MMPL family transporter [Chloroflexota bacterium]
MLFRLGVAMVRFRWWVVGAWAVVFLVAGGLAPRVFDELTPGFGRANTESQEAIDLLAEKLAEDEVVLVVVVSHPTLLASDAAFRQGVEQTLAGLQGYPDLGKILTLYQSGAQSFVSDDGHSTYAYVSLKGGFDYGMETFDEVREKIVAPPGFEVWVTGGVAIFSELNKAAERDLQRAEAISLPLVLAALAIVFGALVAMMLPIAMAAVAVVVTMAAVYILTQTTDISIFVLNIASFLGIGISVDYTLLAINRFREELAHRDRAEAVGVTMSTAGRAILFSGLTTVVGLSGLLFMPFMFFRSLGIGGVTVVVASLLVVLTLVPALLGIMGPRINRFRVLRAAENGANGGLWRSVASWVMAHPVLVSVPVVALLLLLGAPFLGVKLGTPWATVLPAGAEAREGWEKVEREFGQGELTPIAVAVRTQGNVLQPEVVDALFDFTRKIAADPRVERVESIVTLDPSITKEQYQQMYAAPQLIPFPAVQAALAAYGKDDVTVVRVYSKYAVLSNETKALVQDVRQTSRSMGAGVTTLITGATADLEDTQHVMYSYFPWVIVYVVVVTYVVLLVLFRSALLPLKAVLMNALSISASYGALVFIFQDGNLEGLLQFTSSGFVEVTLPILMFCVVFGLSMDYEVFLLSRVKELYDRTKDNTEAVAGGLERTGRIITSAAMVLVLVAAAFATSDVIVVKAFGVGVALAILLDSTLIRALLVPALMRIMGSANWWSPRWLLWALPEAKVEGEAASMASSPSGGGPR